MLGILTTRSRQSIVSVHMVILSAEYKKNAPWMNEFEVVLLGVLVKSSSFTRENPEYLHAWIKRFSLVQLSRK